MIVCTIWFGVIRNCRSLYTYNICLYIEHQWNTIYALVILRVNCVYIVQVCKFISVSINIARDLCT